MLVFAMNTARIRYQGLSEVSIVEPISPIPRLMCPFARSRLSAHFMITTSAMITQPMTMPTITLPVWINAAGHRAASPLI